MRLRNELLLLGGLGLILGGLVWAKPRELPQAPPPDSPRFVPEWETALSFGSPLFQGVSEEVRVVVLYDLACPASRLFHLQLHESDGAVVQAYLVHHPLDYHAHSLDAASLAECVRAEEVEAFSRFVTVALDRQTELGVAAWRDLLEAAGVSDAESAMECLAGGDIPENVSAGTAFAHHIGAPGTPTVIIEGWMLPFTPGPDLMQALVREFAAGRNPFTSTSFGVP